MDWLNLILTIVTTVAGGGWYISYRAYKKKSEGEATQAEAEGWKAQQDVYQQTIEDLKQSCAYIRDDRNLLREENKKLREENNQLRDKYNELEAQIVSLRRDLARQERRLESIFPFACGVAGCANRTRIEIKEEYNDEETNA